MSVSNGARWSSAAPPPRPRPGPARRTRGPHRSATRPVSRRVVPAPAANIEAILKASPLTAATRPSSTRPGKPSSPASYERPSMPTVTSDQQCQETSTIAPVRRPKPAADLTGPRPGQLPGRHPRTNAPAAASASPGRFPSIQPPGDRIPRRATVFWAGGLAAIGRAVPDRCCARHPWRASIRCADQPFPAVRDPRRCHRNKRHIGYARGRRQTADNAL